MDWLSRLLAGVTAALALVGFSGVSLSTPSPAPTTALTPVLERLDASETPPASTPVPATAHCPQWWGLALETGWTADLLPTLDYVLWRESRCDPSAHNTTLNRDRSTDVGLAQVNDRSWCLPTRWYPKGYLQTMGIVPTVGCEQLFDPRINLLSAKAIYDYSQKENGNGWAPWSL